MIRKQVVIMGRVMASAGGVVEVGSEPLEAVRGVPVGWMGEGLWGLVRRLG